jgi:hypothetical protein
MEKDDDASLARLELLELGEFLDEIKEQRKALGPQLGKFYAQAEDIKQAIIRTHHHRMVGEKPARYAVFVAFDRAGAEERAPLFQRGDALRQEYLPAINENRYCNVKIRDIERQISHIEKWLKRKKV